MDTLSDLLVLAQISMAFVGFAAIVVVFRERGGEEWSGFQIALISTMIEFGFAALFFSLLPVVLSRLGITGDLAWRGCSVLIGLFLLVYLSRYGRRRQSAAQTESHNLRPGVFRFWLGSTFGVGVAQLGSSVGVLGLPVDGVYLAGVVWMLASGAIAFMVIFEVFGPQSS